MNITDSSWLRILSKFCILLASWELFPSQRAASLSQSIPLCVRSSSRDWLDPAPGSQNRHSKPLSLLHTVPSSPSEELQTVTEHKPTNWQQTQTSPAHTTLYRNVETWSKGTKTKQQQPPASIDFLESKGLLCWDLRVTQTLRRMSKTVMRLSWTTITSNIHTIYHLLPVTVTVVWDGPHLCWCVRV